MSDRLTPKQALLMWCLLGRHGEAFQRDLVPRVDPKDRRALIANGLISEGRHGRSIVLRVEDRGWRWASEHLRDELQPNYRVLQQWLDRVHHFLAEIDRPLAEFIGPPTEPLPEPASKKPQPSKPRKPTPKKSKSPSPTELRERIEAAYLAVTNGRKAEDAPLSKIRAQLSDLDRKTVDAGLLRILQGDAKARLGRINDPRALTTEEREAAFSPGGEPFHLLWIQP